MIKIQKLYKTYSRTKKEKVWEFKMLNHAVISEILQQGLTFEYSKYSKKELKIGFRLWYHKKVIKTIVIPTDYSMNNFGGRSRRFLWKKTKTKGGEE